MSEENKAIVGRWFTQFWGNSWNPVSSTSAAFPDLNFWGVADLVAEGDDVVDQWEGGGTHTGPSFSDLPLGSLPAGSAFTLDRLAPYSSEDTAHATDTIDTADTTA